MRIEVHDIVSEQKEHAPITILRGVKNDAIFGNEARVVVNTHVVYTAICTGIK
jgi:hypothetical protein